MTPGRHNKLGNHRFLRFTPSSERRSPSPRTHRTVCHPDTDFIVFRSGAFVLEMLEPPTAAETGTLRATRGQRIPDRCLRLRQRLHRIEKARRRLRPDRHDQLRRRMRTNKLDVTIRAAAGMLLAVLLAGCSQASAGTVPAPPKRRRTSRPAPADATCRARPPPETPAAPGPADSKLRHRPNLRPFRNHGVQRTQPRFHARGDAQRQDERRRRSAVQLRRAGAAEPARQRCIWRPFRA